MKRFFGTIISAAILTIAATVSRSQVSAGGVVVSGGTLGSATFTTFLTNGPAYYISPTGNDATAVIGDPSHPWANFYTYITTGGVTNRGGVCVAATNGTIYVMPGTYSVPLIPLNPYVNLVGVGNPTINHNTNMTVNGTNYLLNQANIGNWVSVSTGDFIYGITFVATNQAIFESSFGNYNSISPATSVTCANLAWTNQNFSNVLVQNCSYFGNTDCLISLAPTSCQYTLLNCYLNSDWDAVNMAAGDTQTFYDCDIVSTGTSTLGAGQGRAVTINGILNDFGSTFLLSGATNASGSHYALNASGASAAIHLNSTTIQNTSGTGTMINNQFSVPITGTMWDGTNSYTLSGGAAPTVTSNTALATISLVGTCTPTGGEVSMNTSSGAQSAGALYFTVTFATAAPVPPKFVYLTQANSNSAGIGFKWYATSPTTNGFQINSGVSAPATSTTFLANYTVVY